MQDIKENLANVIRETRTRCRLSQEKLAEAVNLSNHAVIKIESGKGNPKFENLHKIVTYLKIPTARIFCPDDGHERPNLQQLTAELSDCTEEEAAMLLPAIRFLLNLIRSLNVRK